MAPVVETILAAFMLLPAFLPSSSSFASGSWPDKGRLAGAGLDPAHREPRELERLKARVPQP
jgi:hypothetical protein